MTLAWGNSFAPTLPWNRRSQILVYWWSIGYSNPSGLLGPTVEGDAVMSGATYYMQDCPTCGRQLQVRVAYLGRTVMCQHCRGRFLAADSADGAADASSSGLALLQRADELIATADAMKHRAH
jgi:DNA-directed RNA polymerase subunit RPC12/RpoP